VRRDAMISVCYRKRVRFLFTATSEFSRFKHGRGFTRSVVRNNARESEFNFLRIDGDRFFFSLSMLSNFPCLLSNTYNPRSYLFRQINILFLKDRTNT
jgi:hypothetical protein